MGIGSPTHQSVQQKAGKPPAAGFSEGCGVSIRGQVHRIGPLVSQCWVTLLVACIGELHGQGVVSCGWAMGLFGVLFECVEMWRVVWSGLLKLEPNSPWIVGIQHSGPLCAHMRRWYKRKKTSLAPDYRVRYLNAACTLKGWGGMHATEVRTPGREPRSGAVPPCKEWY